MPETQLPARALRLVDGAPDITRLPCDRLLDSGGTEYMRRFYLGQKQSPCARFHLISTSDPGRDMHDHPWDYTTRLLSGTYIEHTPDGQVRYEAPCTLTRTAEQLHRLELANGPVWTYFVTGRYKRTWGFATDHGWTAYTDYAAAGTIAGCGTGQATPGRDPRPAPRTRW